MTARQLSPLVLAAACAALAAGCGGGRSSTTTAGASGSTGGSPAALQLHNKPQDCLSSTQRRRAVRRAVHDAAQLNRLAAPLPRSQMGTPALQEATGRFLDHLQQSKLDYYYQNRLIDRAASAVAFACEQCFQMLEAARPIPAMRYGHSASCG